jgi:hypothetical protein
MVKASVQGFITNEAGNQQIDNATVSIGSYSTTTDVNGYFHFENVTIPKHTTTVIVKKNSFFNGSRTLMIKANQSHIVKIGLIEKGNPFTFNSSNGGTYANNGLSIDFSANGVVNKTTGLPYIGQVTVYAHKIDPTTEVGINSMPGDLRGLNTSNVEQLLKSYGMMVAELYNTNGEALQLANNMPATISMEIPASIVATAPATIPLWYFDEVKGMWMEEGNATLSNGKYIGKVKHFSYWNYDSNLPSITAEFTLVDQNGNPLQGYNFSLHNSNNTGAHGTTNSNGWNSGLVEANATLTFNVYPPYNACSFTPIYTQTVNTGAVNINLGTITVNISNLTNSATISGNIVNCSGTALSNASIVMLSYCIIITPNNSGQFTYTFPCTPTSPITLNTYDLSTNVYGATTTTLVSGTNNLGTLNACGNISQFLNINMTNLTTSVNYTNTITLPS